MNAGGSFTTQRSNLRAAWLLLPGFALLAAALFARVMMEPLRRDEQMFFTVPLLGNAGDIYRDFGFNHLPNLVLLLGPLLRLSEQPFLTGRAILFLAWMAAAALIAAHAWRETRSTGMIGLSVLLLLTCPLLINQTGTAITNNFLPIPFLLAGALAFFAALDRTPPSSMLVALAGFLLAVAAGLKLNYLFVIPPFALASLLVPRGVPFADRLKRITLPMLLGGLLGSLPTLIHLASDPQGFLAHVIGYHTGPHRIWSAQSPEAPAMSLADRVMLAQGVWGTGGVVLTGLAILTILVARVGSGWRPGWKLWVTGGMLLLAILVSFVPKPAFPQYFSPPAAILILFLVLLVGELSPAARAQARPLLIALGMMVIVVDGPRLLRELPALASPHKWTGNQVHGISAEVAAAAAGRPVATLTPIYAVDAGGRIYPELAAGQFMYRVADILPAEHRPHYRLVSAGTLAALLDANPPGAILVGADGEQDAAFRTYVRERGYVAVQLSSPETRYGRLELYVPGGKG